MDTVDAIVIGAGVIGLAVARALALGGREVVVLEAAGHFGTGISSRHSEVIHAGIYYPPGSLKARLCVEGRHRLYDYCAARNIPHRRLGKLIVATRPGDQGRLAQLKERAAANGVTDLQWLSGTEARALEPELRCEAALLSPSTGILDSHALMQSLVGDIESAGGMVIYRSRVDAIRATGGMFQVRLDQDESSSLGTPLVINAAGLDAAALLKRVKGYPAERIPALHYCKGNYFMVGGPSPFSRLVYPLPAAGGLGVHVTLDLAGRARLGPDTQWIDAPDYAVDESRADAFREAVADYFPGVAARTLTPGYAGIRPKLAPAGAADADFGVDAWHEPGGGTLFSLLGIESPGLTACLSLADYVATNEPLQLEKTA
jgi:L-2-hydroxyglutarate oxidase LhgO